MVSSSNKKDPLSHEVHKIYEKKFDINSSVTHSELNIKSYIFFIDNYSTKIYMFFIKYIIQSLILLLKNKYNIFGFQK